MIRNIRGIVRQRAMPRRGAALLLLALATLLSRAAAAEDDFYRGKTITITVGSTAGGAYDLYGRLLARHLGRHIPGAPTILVQDMPGAGSLTSVRYLDASAPKDGTAIASFNVGLITQSFTAPQSVKLKFTDIAWIGTLSREFRVCYAWHATGIKDWADMLAAPDFVMGATAAGTAAYMNGAVLRNVFGMKIRQITGYPGSNEQRLATERGELEGACSEWNALPETWLSQRKINAFVRWLADAPADFPAGVPYIVDLAANQEDRAMLALLSEPSVLGNPFAVSRQVPRARVDILRAAFWATAADPQFGADAAAQKMPIAPSSGAEAERRVAAIYAAATPALVAKLQEAIR